MLLKLVAATTVVQLFLVKHVRLNLLLNASILSLLLLTQFQIHLFPVILFVRLKI